MQNGSLRLSTFISHNLDAILADWVAFAREQAPKAANLDVAALQDHGRLILEEIAADMWRPQDDAERQAKSKGTSASASQAKDVPSRSHARQRERQGFEVEQLVAEYRALRATVLRQWVADSNEAQVQDLEDITRFNEAVDQAVAESLKVFVAEVDRSRDLFLGILGHDLRGPLGTISTCVAVEMRARPGGSPQSAIILRSVAQMKALLDDMVEYTRVRLGSELAIEPSSLQLDHFAPNTLEEIQAIGRGHALELDVRGDMQGEWHARRLHQALSNLVFNAMKYGVRDAPIHISLDGTSKDELVLVVQNSGKPIPPNMMARLFDPLVRQGGEDEGADSQIAGANLGLGLYVVQQIAKAHGGTIAVTSDASVTRFELRLPRITVR
jgi:signal transduction histidine kinase